jgi:CubicO group peptidase (beta-lactamase class C family)
MARAAAGFSMAPTPPTGYGRGASHWGPQMIPIRAIGLAFLLAACGGQDATAPPPQMEGPALDAATADRLSDLVPTLIEEERVAGVGIAVIRAGHATWTGYYGEMAPGVPVTAQTVFNTASVAKTITAETFLKLAQEGLVDLDEPIAPYVQHPDLAADEAYGALTPRILLSHRSGLRNWPFEYENNRLAFDHAPGTAYGYSGAGIELAAQYAEAKTGRALDDLAAEFVLRPLGIEEMAMGRLAPWTEGRVTTPMDETGTYGTVAALNPSLAAGEANGAADDLLSTVPAYARLVEGLVAGELLSDASRAERQNLLTSMAEDPIYGCTESMGAACPDRFGHAIGWQVWEWGDHRVLKHSGSDAGENAIVYYSTDRGHGAVIFVNGANGWVVMTRIIEAIGDEPRLAAYYRGLIGKVMQRDLEPLD